MSMVTVKGVYKNGKVELRETPGDVKESSEVLVTFTDLSAAEDTARQAIIDQIAADLETGLHLGGGPYPKREELYDRTDRRGA